MTLIPAEGPVEVEPQASSLPCPGVHASGVTVSRTSLSASDSCPGAPGGAWTAQDWPRGPHADEASLGMCTAGRCGLTSGLEHGPGADHTNRSLLMPPTDQRSVGPCVVIGPLPLKVKRGVSELGTGECAVRAQGAQTLHISLKALALDRPLPDECSVRLRPGSHCPFALCGAGDRVAK